MPSLNFHVPIGAICSKGHGKGITLGQSTFREVIFSVLISSIYNEKLKVSIFIISWAENDRRYVSFF
jgi:hypothetical protein